MIKARVVHIITKMELGGAQQNTLFTVQHLDPERFQGFLVSGPGGELSEEARAFKNSFVVPDLVREIRPIKDFKAFLQIRDVLQKIKGDASAAAPLIVHTHSSKAGILGRWAARFSGVPVIVHSVHGFGFNDYQPFRIRGLYVFLEKITSRITSKFIAVSQENMTEGVRRKIFTRDRAALIRSGIEIEKFRTPALPAEQTRKALGIPDGAPVVTMISCLKPQKAPLDFVRACEIIRRQVPAAQFLLAGDGRLRGAVEAQVARSGLQGCFRLLGWRRDIPEILHATDVLALSSLWEGLPRVLPQAMAAGVPIVATRVNGTPEAVADSVNGFVVPPGDFRELAEKVSLLLKQPEKAAAMGREGAERTAEFDIHKMVKDQERLYEALLRT